MSAQPRIEIDGHTATAEQLAHPAVAGYGHFTAMQVRDRRTRGIDLHLKRLEEGTRELFDAQLDGDRVLDHIRHALSEDIRDASVRVYVFQPADELSIMVTLRPPAHAPTTPQRLLSAPYERALAHVKHLGGFGQEYYGRVARRSGFDDALLTGPQGAIFEGAVTNIGFFDGDAVIWPDGPSLAGITMQLLDGGLRQRGRASRRAHLRLADVPSFHAAFVCNSRGIAPVSRIDDMDVQVDAERMGALHAIYESVPWDAI
ncbi:MAG TPA: aminotransferase class IV family protein [Egibacteraceae bacterium]|nr:aminotransferase class IV family protein [Egibacteraceae bacterium]